MVESADPMCNRMHVPDIGIGKRDPRLVGTGQHIHPRRLVRRLAVSRQQIGTNQAHRLHGMRFHLRGTEPVAVCLHRVRQRIHPAVGSHIRRQGTAKSRIEKRIARYETVIHDGMLIVACLIRDDSRQRHLRAGSRRRRHRKKKRQLFVYLKHPAHFSDREISPYCARSRHLGTVHNRAASDGKDRLTAGYKKTFRCRLHLRHRRIRRYLCV